MGHWRRSDCSWMVSFRGDLLERVQQGVTRQYPVLAVKNEEEVT